MIRCSKCKQPIGEEDFNVSTDCAFCRKCGTVLRFSDLAEAAWDSDVDLGTPPRGIRIYDDGGGEALRLRHYSGVTWGIACFAVLWNSFIISAFVGGVWKSEGWQWGTLFFIPFLAVGIGMIVAVLYQFFGRSEVRFSGGELETFSGIGPIGVRRHFPAKGIRKVEVCSTGSPRNHTSLYGVYLHTGDEKKKLCTGSNAEKLEFIATYLRRRLKQGR